MPFAYLAHLRAFLCLWLALLPWVFVHSYVWYTLILTTLVCYGVLGIEEAAVEESSLLDKIGMICRWIISHKIPLRSCLNSFGK